LIADARSGGDQVKGQSHRSVAMKVGETLGPAAGGALVLLAWYAPMALQALAIPLAAASWRHVPSGRTTGNAMGQSLKVLMREFKNPDFVLLQSVGFFRFFFKFGFLTYMPLLAVQSGILSIVETGIVLTLSAAAALVMAAAMTRVPIKRPSSVLLGVNLAFVGLSLVMIGAATAAPLLIAGSILFGIADSAASIIYSAVITSAVNDEMRATFVAANGAVRNLGKFAAPIVVGIILIGASLATGFYILGGGAVLVGFAARRLRTFDALVGPRV